VDTELLESAGVGRLSMLGGSTAAGVGTMPMAGFQKGGSLKIEVLLFFWENTLEFELNKILFFMGKINRKLIE
jgi:hypothetical protein